MRNTSSSAYYKSIEKSRYNAPPVDSDDERDDDDQIEHDEEELHYPEIKEELSETRLMSRV
jgi:hypothetical protein